MKNCNLLAAILAITMASCSSDSVREDSAAAAQGPVDQFELADRNGKTYVLTDLYSCAPTDKITGDQRCDYRQFYLLSGGVHYRFDWDSIRSIERQGQGPGDVFKLTLKGGPGTYSVMLSRAYPEVHATILDLPPVIRIASGLIEQQGASARVATLPGDYHTTPFPEDNDAILFFGMMHQESPEKIQALLRKAYDAIAPGASVYVMDMMTDPSHTAPKFSALFAVNMALTSDSGWVFSSAELEGWTKAAGFVEFEVRPLPSPIPHWLASARKPA